MESKEYRYVVTQFAEHSIYTFAMRVGDLLQMQYVASRGVSTEQGAVQRILNKSRVDAISKFVLAGNSFEDQGTVLLSAFICGRRCGG